MDKKMIIDLVFDGNCYRDDINLYENKDYCKHNDALNELHEKLTKDLPEEEKRQTSWDLFDALGGLESVIEQVFFDEGFKLGLKIAAQSFLEK